MQLQYFDSVHESVFEGRTNDKLINVTELIKQNLLFASAIDYFRLTIILCRNCSTRTASDFQPLKERKEIEKSMSPKMST